MWLRVPSQSLKAFQRVVHWCRPSSGSMATAQLAIPKIGGSMGQQHLCFVIPAHTDYYLGQHVSNRELLVCLCLLLFHDGSGKHLRKSALNSPLRDDWIFGLCKPSMPSVPPADFVCSAWCAKCCGWAQTCKRHWRGWRRFDSEIQPRVAYERSERSRPKPKNDTIKQTSSVYG